MERRWDLETNKARTKAVRGLGQALECIAFDHALSDQDRADQLAALNSGMPECIEGVQLMLMRHPSGLTELALLVPADIMRFFLPGYVMWAMSVVVEASEGVMFFAKNRYGACIRVSSLEGDVVLSEVPYATARFSVPGKKEKA